MVVEVTCMSHMPDMQTGCSRSLTSSRGAKTGTMSSRVRRLICRSRKWVLSRPSRLSCRIWIVSAAGRQCRCHVPITQEFSWHGSRQLDCHSPDKSLSDQAAHISGRTSMH